MVDVLLIVSSAIEDCCARPFVHGCVLARATYCFSSGGDCISYVQTLPETTSIVVVVDTRIRDISSLNLVNSLRMAHPCLQAIVVVPRDGGDMTDRAMLAGACSAVYDTCSKRDLETVITKIVKGNLFRRSDGAIIKEDNETGGGHAVAVVSARGGSGKSYLSTLLSATFSRCHKDTLLLDADIQFSDLGLLFHKSRALDASVIEELSSLDTASLHGLAYPIRENLGLIRFETTPFHSEALGSKVTAAVRSCRKKYEATVVNTGGFWSLFQSNLLESCNCVVVTCDHSLGGIKATRQLLAHFEQLHIPLAQVIVVVNRYSKRGVAFHDIEKTLGSIQVVSLESFPQDACTSMDAGQPLRVLEEFDGIAESCMVLAERVSMMTGMPLHGCQEFDAHIGQRSWVQKVFGL